MEQRAANEELFVFHFHMTLCDLYDRMKLRFPKKGTEHEKLLLERSRAKDMAPSKMKVLKSVWNDKSTGWPDSRLWEEKPIRSVRVGRHMEVFNENRQYVLPDRRPLNVGAKDVARVTEKLKKKNEEESSDSFMPNANGDDAIDEWKDSALQWWRHAHTPSVTDLSQVNMDPAYPQIDRGGCGAKGTTISMNMVDRCQFVEMPDDPGKVYELEALVAGILVHYAVALEAS